MRSRSALRPVALALLASVSLSAFAVDAYSNFAGAYVNSGYLVSPAASLGYQFVPTVSGAASSYSLAISNASGTVPTAYTLSLYADSGANTLGSPIRSYAALSNGQPFRTATALSVVPASGAPVALTSGTKYWLVASSANELAWNWVDGTATQATYYTIGTAPVYAVQNAGAFSVQVVPEPATFAALALGLAGLARRRRR